MERARTERPIDPDATVGRAKRPRTPRFPRTALLAAILALIACDGDGPSSPDPDREAALANFSRTGIVDVDFRPKPALAVWDSIRARPLAP